MCVCVCVVRTFGMFASLIACFIVTAAVVVVVVASSSSS